MRGEAMALVRARQVLHAAGIQADTPIERATSVNNEVWLTPDVVVRVGGRGHRLHREVALAEHLPATVRYPAVVHGPAPGGPDAMVTARVPGRPLAHAWPGLTVAQRRAAVEELASLLRALHATPMPPEVPDAISPQGVEGDADAPARAIFAAAERAVAAGADATLVAAAGAYVTEHLDALHPFPTTHLVHGDLTFENVLWHDGRITALLDLEYAAGRPSDVELDVLLRMCAYPQLFVGAEHEQATRAADYDQVPLWFRGVHEDPFRWPRLVERLRIYAIGFDLRELAGTPVRNSGRHLPEGHPHQRLRRTLEGRSYLDSHLEDWLG